jgi:hypothetical protein
MSAGRRVDLTATHPAEWLAALPVIVGYQLHHGTAVTFTADDGGMVCTAAVHNGTTREQLLDAFGGQAGGLIHAGSVTTWTAVHDLDPTLAWDRARMLADVLAACGLPRPDPRAQYTVAGHHAWPSLLTHPHPGQIWDLDAHTAVRDRLELLLGTPAEDRALVGSDLTARPSRLRADIAAALPNAADDPQAREDPARWRVAAAANALGRLTDPQPWTGDSAARVLLALSDENVLAFLLDHTARTDPGVWLTPDTGLLAALVRAAPPGLVAGPATLLAGALTSRGMTSTRARAAAALAVADRPDSATALTLLTGLAAGQRPHQVIAAAVGDRIATASAVGPVFTAGDGHWPDPLTATGLNGPGPDPWTGPDPAPRR